MLSQDAGSYGVKVESGARGIRGHWIMLGPIE